MPPSVSDPGGDYGVTGRGRGTVVNACIHGEIHSVAEDIDGEDKSGGLHVGSSNGMG
jgi:hypothetical protein